MKNREFYREQILNANKLDFCEDFIKPIVLQVDSCYDTGCAWCRMYTQYWLEEEYEPPAEPEVDWTKVEVDTPILVSDDAECWCERHFARFKDGKVLAWLDGTTSWSANKYAVKDWLYAKLAEKEN